MENLINEFGLQQEYKAKNMEEAVNTLREQVETDVTNENAYQIIVRSSAPQKAADMVNYLLDYLNETVVRLNVQKSKNNREFLGQRYDEIVTRLTLAEDSLQKYQEQSGIFEAGEQVKLMLGAYSELETGLIEKQLELSFLEKTLPEGYPNIERTRVEYNIFKEALDSMKRMGKDNSIFLAYNSLPQKAKNFLRHYRDVQIYRNILEFVLPLYEQARFEEAKNIPVLQIIDYGSVPVKRSYPKRTFMALLIAVFITSIYIFFLITIELIRSSQNAKMIAIRNQVKLLR